MPGQDPPETVGGEPSGTPSAARLFAGPGPARAALRRVDWAATPLGPVAGWSAALRTTVRTVLGSRFPMVLFWGPEWVQFYNDAFAPSLVAKDSAGRPGLYSWAEVWGWLSEQLADVARTGEANSFVDQLVDIVRRGFVEESYWTYSHSPVYGDDDAIAGVLCTLTENTEQVLAQRRLDELGVLAGASGVARTVPEACELAAEAIAHDPYDLPFALLYLVDEDGTATLAGRCGLDADDPAAAPDGRGWPLGRLLADLDGGESDIGDPFLGDSFVGDSFVGDSFVDDADRDSGGDADGDTDQVLVDDLADRFPGLTAGPWPERPRGALLLPLRLTRGTRPAAVLVAGLSARLPLDARYREFLGLVQARLAANLADARGREQERERIEAMTRLDRAKTEFFSNVSHEFRTPLTLIMGPAEQLRAQVRDPGPAAELRTLHHNALRLGKLVDALLDFSRVEAGRADPHFEQVDLASLTEGLASAFDSAMERAGLTFEVSCDPLPEPAWVDREMWEQVVLNLLSNALKFTLAGSVRLTLTAEGPNGVLRVTDTGVGIPESEVGRLFERFHRVPGTRARSAEGSGIGLALARSMVELHGGTIAATSTEGVGSTFTVTLPLGRRHLQPNQVSTTRAAPVAVTSSAAPGFLAEALRWLPGEAQDTYVADQHGTDQHGSPVPERAGDPVPDRPVHRVLVVDDNADMRDYLHRLLAPGHRVQVLRDGAEALSAIRIDPPDLVLVDVMMPGLDGIELVRALRADPVTAPVPVLLLSARAGHEAAAEGLAAGADDYMVKPFTAGELLARVDNQLRMSGIRRETEQRFRALADATPALIWVDGPDGHRRFVNRAWRAFVGAATEDTDGDLGTGWRSRIHPLDQDRYAMVRSAAEQRGESFEVEYRLRDAADTYRWVLDRGAPVRGGRGTGGYVGGCLDIDTRYRERERQRVLAQVATAMNVDVGSDARRTALAHSLVAEGLVDVVCLVDTDKPAAPAFAARSDTDERVIAALRGPWRHSTSALEHGEPILIDVDDEFIENSSDDPEQRERRRSLGVHSVALVPLMARGRVSGLLAAGRTEPSPRIDKLDFELLVDIGARAAVALDNAHLLEQEQRTNQRMELLQQATAALSAAATPAQVADTLVAEYRRMLGTDSVVVFELRETGTLDVLRLSGWNKQARRDWPTLPLDSPAPASVAATQLRPVWVETWADWERDFPYLVETVRGYDHPAINSLPLVAAGECLGVVAFGFREERRLTPPERSAVLALADLGAQALQRAGLLAAENEARRAAEDLSAVVGALSRATTTAEVGNVVLEYATQLGASGAVVTLRAGEELEVLCATPPAPPVAERLPLDAPHPLAYSVRCGEPVWLASRSSLAWRDGGFPAVGPGLAVQVSVPLIAGWTVLGAIGLRYADEVPVLDAAVRSRLLTVAGQCAQALDRARMHEAEHEVAEVLQRSLLPRQLPTLDRLSMATSYRPAAQGTQAGGDWYDVLPVSESRIAIVVGDVVGNGAAAAAVMGQLRSALAGYLLEGHSPADALDRLDRFAARVDGALGSTCCCLVLDWDTGEVCYANAGHPPILTLGPGGPAFLDEARGTVLAMRGRPPCREAGAKLAPGSTVLLYTDGLVERRHEPLVHGLRRLSETAAALTDHHPLELVDSLVARMVDGLEQQDDVAVVAVRLVPEPLHERRPAAAGTARAARLAAAEWARLAALPPDLVDDLQLTLGEAIANAVEHAYRDGSPDSADEVEYEVGRLADGGLAVVVTDRGTWRPPSEDRGFRGRGLQMIRGIAEDVQLATDDGTTIRFTLPPPGARPLRPDLPAPARLAPPPEATGTPVTRTWRMVGDVTTDTVDSARRELLALLEEPGDLVVDLSQAGYLGSAAVSLLAEAIGTARDRGTRLSVRVARGSFAERAITVTDLADAADITWVDPD